MKKSDWLKGVLHAEKIGVRESLDNVYKNEYSDNPIFLSGVLDYIKHAKERLKS